ncbi:ribose-5-phosphate isomerase RpiA [Salicibibacter halophilus]|uniref:Ribose-5-phosphate isomerase A n=1 Tax=Salicibibacter halophilus TaxID=2502791 RepID=A0A514LL24_9BACI|nr:ribose-5-phosphate isomerase RpiA [Salicibibacter halophilus]QDI92567.1 ribose-5-phosphate isomerase RpiA [Salicibibacter halophilus]
MEQQKERLAKEAVKYVEEGMVVGLGSGSTVNWTLEKLAEEISRGLKIKGVPSSKKTEAYARKLGIPLTDFSKVDQLDVAIDGANEVDENFNLIKGGGGSLFREKMVGLASKNLLIIIENKKNVAQLGLPVPVEVVPYGWRLTAAGIEKTGGKVRIRKHNDKCFITDNGNYILDCSFGNLNDPYRTNQSLKLLVGVVETGLFVNMASTVIVGKGEKVETMAK